MYMLLNNKKKMRLASAHSVFINIKVVERIIRIWITDEGGKIVVVGKFKQRFFFLIFFYSSAMLSEYIFKQKFYSKVG